MRLEVRSIIKHTLS